MDGKQLGRKINAARKDIGITSEKLAEICSINATYLRQIEAGSKVPSLQVFLSICNALKASPTYLLQDSLDCPECAEMDEVLDLWKNASPKQIKLITSMVKSALESMQE